MKDLISIIVPVYNRENTIERCLNSLIKQSYKNIEIICINDGSKDNSLKILKAFAKKDKRIKLINNSKNMGIAYSRNKGLETATAEYIMWCDSDDWFEKNMCKKMLKAILKHNVNYAECSAKITFNDEKLGIRKNWNAKKDWLLNWKGKQNINVDICKNSGCFLWNKIFKKSLIKKWKLSFPPISHHEDSVFVNLYMLLSKNAYFLKEKLYNYVVHSGSAIDKFYTNSVGFTEFGEIDYFVKYVGDFLSKNKLKDVYPLYNELVYSKIFTYLLNSNNLLLLMDNTLNYNYNSLSERLKFKKMEKENIELQEIREKSKLKREAERKKAERKREAERIKAEKAKAQPMEIFFTADDKYSEHLATTLASVLLNASHTDRFNFHILDSGISKKNQKKILKLKEIKPCNIDFIRIDKSLFKDFPLEISYMTIETYYKYLIPQIKPDIDRALYLDCDLIVRNSLHHFYYQKFNGKAIAVCDDAFWDSDFAKKYKIKHYFNAGVLLINCKKWREKNYVKEVFKQTKLLKKNVKHEDQDVLNYVFKDDKLMCSQRYNLQVYSAITNKFKNKTMAEILSITVDPVIMHYNTKQKPWMGHCIHPYAMEYFIYKNKTPYKDRVKKDLKNIIG